MPTQNNILEQDEVIPFKAEHVAQMNIADKYKNVFLIPHLFEVYEQLGSSFTFYEKGKIYAVGGVIKFWEGAGEAWFVLSDEMDLPVYSLCATIKHHLDELLKYDFKRIQATVKHDDEKALRFIEWLGFEREGLLKQFGIEGADYYMYARGSWQQV